MALDTLQILAGIVVAIGIGLFSLYKISQIQIRSLGNTADIHSIAEALNVSLDETNNSPSQETESPSQEVKPIETA